MTIRLGAAALFVCVGVQTLSTGALYHSQTSSYGCCSFPTDRFTSLCISHASKDASLRLSSAGEDGDGKRSFKCSLKCCLHFVQGRTPVSDHRKLYMLVRSFSAGCSGYANVQAWINVQPARPQTSKASNVIPIVRQPQLFFSTLRGKPTHELF